MKDYLNIERGMNKWKCEDIEADDFGRGSGGGSARNFKYSKKEDDLDSIARSMKNSLMLLPLLPIASFGLAGLIVFGGLIYTTAKEEGKVKKMAAELIKKESLRIPFFPQLSRGEFIDVNRGKGLAFRIADKNQNYILEDKELYNLGKGLGVITNGERISRKLLINKIRDASIEKYEMYIDNFYKNN